MITKFLEAVYPNDEDRRAGRILFLIIRSLLIAYAIVIGTAVFWGDVNLIIFTSAGGVALLIPLALLFRGKLRAAGFAMILAVLISATAITTVGQGVHDTGIMAYPVIVIIASLILQRRDFLIASFLALAAFAWLVIGESTGIFVIQPVPIPTWTDFLVMATILGMAILTVDLLATNMRENLHQAQQEIIRRKVLEEQLRYQSIHDVLTGLYNRTFFEEELSRLDRGRDFPVSIIVADVNDLKVVNDTQGHAAGDEILRQVAEILGQVFRAGDILARIGGDEYVVLLAHTDAPTAVQMLERIQQKLVEHNEQHPDLPIQVALGTATAGSNKLTEAFVIADQRMYAEKAQQKLRAKPGQ
jgi:diguanylate cyclase (GGDEF)-like protein